MAKKKQQVKKPREMSKRQLSRWQKQARRERIIRYTGISILIAVICVVAAGIFITQFKPLFDTAIRVNDTKFNTQYYINMLKHFREFKPGTNIQLLSFEVDKAIKQNELIRQGALELGITVSDDEVDTEIEDRDPPFHRDVVRTQLLTQKLLDEHFEQEVPTSADQRHIQAIFLEGEAQALEITDKLNAGEGFAELATEYSLDAATKDKNGDIGWHPRGIVSLMLSSPVAEDYAFNAEIGVLSQPIYDEDKPKGAGYWLIKIQEQKEDSDAVKIGVMLLGSEAGAQEAQARLAAGDDFGDVAADMSQLDEAEENRGDIGEVTPGILSTIMNDFIFDPEVEVGEVSEPIHDENTATVGGYWLIKVVDKDADREIDDEDRTTLKNIALGEWVQSLEDDPDNEVESLLGGDKVAWAVEKATGS
ncbi:peptidylprolyl isomerase [Bacteroidota bacterium]